MLTGRTEPFSIRDDHERRSQTGRVIAAVTGIAKQDLHSTGEQKVRFHTKTWFKIDLEKESKTESYINSTNRKTEEILAYKKM